MSSNIITEVIILRDTDDEYFWVKKRELDIITGIIISVEGDELWENIV